MQRSRRNIHQNTHACINGKIIAGSAFPWGLKIVSADNFHSRIKTLAQDWFDNPLQKFGFTTIGLFSNTATGSCRVSFGENNIGYIKPNTQSGDSRNLLVAREKIAADLAHALGFPVAPVVIRMPTGDRWNHPMALSLSCLQSPRPWNPDDADLAKMAVADLERLRIFWSWIGDVDHNGNRGNLLYERTGSTCRVIAIDHARSMCHSCDQYNPDRVGMCMGYATAELEGAAEARACAAKLILDAGMRYADLVVHRLDTILTPEAQIRIMGILEGRLELLPAWAA
ncbi:hypothetical protein [Asticcacaulis solisilvae]|uniref:hypothetical protein n=1 Tax=Asticcacaulis solisilvae TaxID=1217274 RepID=UPI003FD6D1A6